MNKEVQKLEERENQLTSVKMLTLGRLEDLQAKIAEGSKKDSDIRKQIRLQKDKYRIISKKRRQADPDKNKIFSKFLHTHEAKELLRKRANQLNLRPTTPRESFDGS